MIKKLMINQMKNQNLLRPQYKQRKSNNNNKIKHYNIYNKIYWKAKNIQINLKQQLKVLKNK